MVGWLRCTSGLYAVVAVASVYNSVTGDQVIGFSKVKVITGLKVNAFAGLGGEDVPKEQEPPPVFELVLIAVGVLTSTILAILPVNPVLV